jgi:uncharacterized protein (TIGR03000 family)
MGLGCSGYGGCYGSSYSSSYGAGWGPAVGMATYGAIPMTLNPRYTDPWMVYGRVNAPPVVVVPTEAKPTDAKPMETPVAPKPKEGMGANLKFQLPADAKLYVDGRLTMIGGTERSFTTPPLAEGSTYYYDVKAEIIVNGKPVVEEKRVRVAAGATITETFPTLTAALERRIAARVEK